MKQGNREPNAQPPHILRDSGAPLALSRRHPFLRRVGSVSMMLGECWRSAVLSVILIVCDLDVAGIIAEPGRDSQELGAAKLKPRIQACGSFRCGEGSQVAWPVGEHVVRCDRDFAILKERSQHLGQKALVALLCWRRLECSR